MPLPSQAALNNILWVLSLVLQIALVAALFARNIAGRLPAFTTLVAFYPIRAALLFGLYNHLGPPTYATLYTSLSLFDLLLQAVLILEIVIHILHEFGGWTILRACLLLSTLAAAALAGAVLNRLLPAHSPIPIDRAQTFLSCFMLALFLWTILASRSFLLRPITLGLALYASVSLASQAGRTTAALHRDAVSYRAWSYATGAAYLIVVALWLLTLKLQPNSAAHSQAATSPKA